MTFAKRFSIGILAVLTAAAVTFTSCKKDTDNDSDTSIATDNYNAQKESDGIVDALNSAAVDNGIMRVDETASTLLPECANVIVDTISSPKSITIEFSPAGSGCLCSDWDGKYRKGKIIATWTGKYRDAGTVITIHTEDYYVNNNKHEYNKTVINNGQNSAGHLTYSVNISLAKITFDDGSIFQMTSNRTREWMEGANTLTPYDDVYNITGDASGTSRAGVPFTFTITNPLVVDLGCKWIKQGTILIEPDGKPSRTLDFGSGACDSQATVEINGTAYNIDL